MKKIENAIQVSSFGSEGGNIFYKDGTAKFKPKYDSSDHALSRLLEKLDKKGIMWEAFWRRNDGGDEMFNINDHEREDCDGEEWTVYMTYIDKDLLPDSIKNKL